MMQCPCAVANPNPSRLRLVSNLKFGWACGGEQTRDSIDSITRQSLRRQCVAGKHTHPCRAPAHYTDGRRHSTDRRKRRRMRASESVADICGNTGIVAYTERHERFERHSTIHGHGTPAPTDAARTHPWRLCKLSSPPSPVHPRERRSQKHPPPSRPAKLQHVHPGRASNHIAREAPHRHERDKYHGAGRLYVSCPRRGGDGKARARVLLAARWSFGIRYSVFVTGSRCGSDTGPVAQTCHVGPRCVIWCLGVVRG